MKRTINKEHTPMVKQYLKIKKDYPDTILLYRVGDFYETFFNDAIIASEVLNIALTSRGFDKNGKKIPLAGIPHHALDQYLYKFVQHGLKVAICEQTENPKFADGIVKRDVIRVATPGTFYDEKLVDEKSNINIVSFIKTQDKIYFSYCDLSTGEFHFSEVNNDFQYRKFLSVLTMLSPREIIIAESFYKKEFETDELLRSIKKSFPNTAFNFVNDWKLDIKYARSIIEEHLKVNSLKSSGFEFDDEIITAGGLLDYLMETQKNGLAHIRTITPRRKLDYMFLDLYTQLNLDLVPNGKNNGANLFDIIDNTKTPMGARLLKNRILRPLTNIEHIRERLDFIDELMDSDTLNIEKTLSEIKDIERITSKIALKTVKPPQFLTILYGVSKFSELKNFIEAFSSMIPVELNKKLNIIEKDIVQIKELIENSIAPEPPAVPGEKGIFKNGYNTELDDLRELQKNGKSIIKKYLNNIKNELNIPSIKLGYNKIYGYYFEISRTKLKEITLPEGLIRKQTLVSSERFITEELKKIEDDIINAEEKILSLEKELWEDFLIRFEDYFHAIIEYSSIVAELDFIISLKISAVKYNYMRPFVDNGNRIRIINGRHPIIEVQDLDEPFVPNDTDIDYESQVQIITGPNMSGKSTYLRQIATIVLMAQIGSFVPADEAHIGIIDRIFTRIGASDNLALGQSTFMVEMNEVANILNSCTDNSLILLDEIGRGTSTYDGLAIAWAVVEFLHNKKGQQSKTLFATHYHEMIKITNYLNRVKIFKVDVREYENRIIFLRKVVEGGTDKSYGIYVAELAGIPNEVIKRAKDILMDMQVEGKGKKILPKKNDYIQPALFSLNKSENQLNSLKKIKKIDINNIKPIEALNLLNELKKEMENEE